MSTNSVKKLITSTIITCYLAVLPVLGLADDAKSDDQAKPVGPYSKTILSKANSTNAAPKSMLSAEVVSVEVDEEDVSDGNEAGQTSKVERVVMPFTEWVEKRIQNTSIVKPSVIPNKNKHKRLPGISLREAIERARTEHKGTVLGAERIEKENDLIYRIKIISQDGVIKIVEINGIAQNQDSEQ